VDHAERLLSAGRDARNIERLIRRELKLSTRIPLGRRLWAWSKGFVSQSTLHYDLDPTNVADYVSDYARFVKTARINGRFASALNNKIVFSRMLASYGCDVPESYCLVTGGRFVQIGDAHPMRSPADVVRSCLSGGEFVVKPYSGGTGHGVLVLKGDGDRIVLNEQTKTTEEVERLLAGLDEALICEFVRQHEYSSRIFPHATNSIRFLTMWDHERNEPFIPLAVHRFGVNASIPVDNGSQGGLICLIDMETGTMVRGLAGHTGVGPLVPHERHPDTDVSMEGTVVPNWEATTGGLLDLARRMSYIPYIGWDVVITEKGFTVIEGNSYPDVRQQVLFPLLTDPRGRAFYRAFNVI